VEACCAGGIARDIMGMCMWEAGGGCGVVRCVNFYTVDGDGGWRFVRMS